MLYCTVNKILHGAGTMMIVTHIEGLVHARMGLALKDKVSDSEVVEPGALYIQTMILFAPAVRFVGPKGQELLWHQCAYRIWKNTFCSLLDFFFIVLLLCRHSIEVQ